MLALQLCLPPVLTAADFVHGWFLFLLSRPPDSALIPSSFNNPFPPFHYLIIPDILWNTHSNFGLGWTLSAPRPCTCPSFSHGRCFPSFSWLTPSILHSVVLGHRCLIRPLGLPLSQSPWQPPFPIPTHIPILFPLARFLYIHVVYLPLVP